MRTAVFGLEAFVSDLIFIQGHFSLFFELVCVDKLHLIIVVLVVGYRGLYLLTLIYFFLHED